MQGYNREFFKRFWFLIKPYWTSEEKWKAYGLLSLITFGIIFQVMVNVQVNRFYKTFYDAIQEMNARVVLLSIFQFSLIVTAYLLVAGYSAYFTGRLTIHWRRWLTQHYLNHWLKKNNFYRMEVLNLSIDNPDQRISEDLDFFPVLTIGLYHGFLSALLNLISFSIILWNLSSNFPIHFLRFEVPGYLFWTAFFYAVIGTVLTIKIGRWLPFLNYMQQQYNANFRFGLVRVREFNEQIALFGGQNTEGKFLEKNFSFIFSNFLKIIKLQLYLNFFRNGYMQIANIIGACAALPLFFAKKIKFGGLTQISSAFGEVISALSFFIVAFFDIANWHAVIYRLTEFEHRMQLADKHESLEHIEIKKDPGQTDLQCKQVMLYLPTREVLLENFNFTIHQGDHVLIMGETGSGKSTLLRFLGGIWPYGRGEIILPQVSMLFLPQRPYFPLGSLKEALAYPGNADESSPKEMKLVLQACDLGVLTERLEEVNYWSKELSLGEQQKLAFARVLLQKPAWVFLDEATSALDSRSESRMYELFKKHLPALTLVSVGHRESLVAWHERRLTLIKGGEAQEGHALVS
ncbi:MAG: hypothetical protein A3I12_00735 [Gammaproteobacteria bacterium RIFCSPLOWO2_02_FULL_38_11]|nr:MAG: hypothetical protein A3I12_00735 [Gammaproteobacteria bacterium RIFCSPLOWO2_02_FULL_38_11]